MAPEQARGEEVDARADLYSVGVLAWEMLTGKLPYMAGDALSMAVMHAQDPIPRLPRHLRHWQRFLDKALAKSPATCCRAWSATAACRPCTWASSNRWDAKSRSR
jgi:serine/threonine protein kinase